MKRFAAVAIVIGFFALLAAALTPAFAWEIDAMNDQIEKTSVIVSDDCSGTVISVEKRLVVTSNHCFGKRTPVFIETKTHRDYDVVAVNKFAAKIVGRDKATDGVLLQVTDPSWKPQGEAPLAPDSYDYKRGRVVYAVGNPLVRLDNSLSSGIISAPARTEDFGFGGKLMFTAPAFQHTAAVVGGSSGGAVYDDNGELIGTTTGYVPGAGISFAVPIKFTKALLRRSGFGDIIKN